MYVHCYSIWWRYRHTKMGTSSVALLLFVAVSVSCQSMSFPDSSTENVNATGRSNASGGGPEGNRSGKNLFNWLGSFADEEADPYLSSANSACLQGDMTECFKARALSGLGDFFVRDSYRLNENVRVVRQGGDDDAGRSSRAFEFSTEERPEDTEWDKLVKFAMRKVERFLRSTAVEVNVPDELTEGGRYSPRFIDEISSELDTLEDKKASIISEYNVPLSKNWSTKEAIICLKLVFIENIIFWANVSLHIQYSLFLSNSLSNIIVDCHFKLSFKIWHGFKRLIE